MAGLTTYAEGNALNLLLRGTAFTAPAAVYIGLLTTMPTGDDGTGLVEVSGGGYARPQISFGAYVSRRIASSNAPSWTASGNWGTVVGFGIWDAAAGGNLLCYGTFNTPVTINATSFALAVGEIIVEVTKLGPYLAQRLLELLFKATQHSSVGTITCRLYTTAPTDDGTGGTEVAGTGYAGQTTTLAAFSSATKRLNLSADLTFTTSAGSSWGDIPAFAFFAGANFLGQGAILPLPTVGAGAAFHAVQNLGRPFRKVPLHQAQVQKPFARIIDDVQMHGARAGQTPQQALAVQPQRQAQLADMARAFGPMGGCAGEGRQVAFEVKAGHGVVGLGLQPGRLDAAVGCGAQRMHPPPVHQVGDQRRDEHGLARPRQARDPQPDHRIAQADACHQCAADTHSACLCLAVFSGR